ncbi:MAG TPA: cation-transporting P-type ATPase [Syntrophales bacterium]|nr:cation-transporting P-type ATPase [Syntrophales bacterium]
MNKALADAHSRPWQDIVQSLQVSPETGLSRMEAEERKNIYGSNVLAAIRRKSAWKILTDQFKSLIVLLLVTAAGLSFVFGEYLDGFAILVVLIINTLIGFFTELKAVRSMEALRKLGSVITRVLREGRSQEVPAEDLVPGDIVLFEGGDVVSADMRIVDSSRAEVDESTLTGESFPVEKTEEPVPAGADLAERFSMLFKGTSVTKGSGRAVVTATGMETEVGRISALVQEAKEETTPLEKRLDELGRRLIHVTLIVAAVVAAAGIVTGKDPLLMIEMAIALAVAAIPEGLPIVATLTLARGMLRMARRNALVNRLSAVETLGATTVICTDKTGTLTENRMTVTRIVPDRGEIRVDPSAREEAGFFFRNGDAVSPERDPVLRKALAVGVLCNNAALPDNPEGAPIGDPMEVALLRAGALAGISRPDLLREYREVRQEAFDPEIKMMATVHRRENLHIAAVKGAAESVLDSCSAVYGENGERPLGAGDKEEWLEKNNELAARGLRIIAVAFKNLRRPEEDPYSDLCFIGLVGLLDPPRGDVKEALTRCRSAGIRVVMITGDQAITARTIALDTGLVDRHHAEVLQGKEIREPGALSPEEVKRIRGVSIFARVSPGEKLNLIAIHQKEGEIVAMTGDGVNDAPALKKADIGIAMGLRGTQVAREAADMVLRDDSFATIVAAVEQGRIIFGNLRKFVVYLLSCNVSEILVVGLASLINAPLPILPLQILFLNIVTDVFPALALGAGEGDPSIMARNPRDPREPVLARRHWRSISGNGFLISASVLGAFAVSLLRLELDLARAVTISFLVMAFSQLWLVFNMREPGTGILKNDITRNRFIWGALLLCSVILVASVYVPVLSSALRLADPGPEGWLLVVSASILPLAAGQAAIARKSRRKGNHHGKR